MASSFVEIIFTALKTPGMAEHFMSAPERPINLVNIQP